MQLVEYCVYVQFAPDGTNLNGKEFSYEPRKWVLIFTKNIHIQGLNYRIEEFGLSEFATSLNLKIRILPAQLPQALSELKEVFRGSEQINIFSQIEATPMLQKRPADIIRFEERKRVA